MRVIAYPELRLGNNCHKYDYMHESMRPEIYEDSVGFKRSVAQKNMAMHNWPRMSHKWRSPPYQVRSIV